MRETERGASSGASRTSGSVIGVGERVSGGGLGGWDEEREDDGASEIGMEREREKEREKERERERERVNEERRKGGGGGGGHWWSRKKKAVLDGGRAIGGAGIGGNNTGIVR